ncbi:MAG: polysaccharide biosynthesis tyrosine autokinase [Pseudomonadota bacterium]
MKSTNEKFAQDESVNNVNMIDQTFGPKEFISAVISNWIMLVGFIGVSLFLATAYLYITRPDFKAEAIVLFESKSNELALAYGDVGGGSLNSGQTLAEIEIIRSQVVLSRVVQDQKSYIVVRPRHFPVVGEALARRNSWLGKLVSGVPGLRRYVWSPADIAISTFDVPARHEGINLVIRVMPDRQFDLLLGEKTLVTSAKVGQLVLVKLDPQDVDAELRLFVSDLEAPVGAQFSATRLKTASAINRIKGAIEVSEAVRGSGVIRISATAYNSSSASDLANAVSNAYLRQNVERRSAEAAQTLAFLKTQLPIVRNKVESAEGELNTYRLKNSSVDLEKEAGLVLDDSSNLERARNEISQKRAELLLTLTPEHPSVRALDLQQSRLATQSDKIQKSIEKLPTTQQELLRLRRDVEVNTTLYTTMLNNMQQLEVAEAGTLGNVRIIDPASPPGGPFNPKPLVVLIAGLIAGLAAGLFTLIIRRLLDHAEHDPAVIEQITGVPVYATVPFSRVQSRMFQGGKKKEVDGNNLIVVADPHDAAAEAIRSLRTTLHFSVFENKHKSIMFSGPTPGVGKSFVTSNLSAVLAQAPMNVILIDADMRRGTIHEYYGLKRGKGLSNFVLGSSLDEVLQPSGIVGLNIISTGDVPPNPAELLLSPRFAQLVAEAEARADLVLVDTGPVLAVTDAGIVGQVVGGSLLVFKAGQHSRREIQDTVKRLAQVGVRVRGLVINQVGRGGGYGSYGYGNYGYYYSYKYGKNA